MIRTRPAFSGPIEIYLPFGFSSKTDPREVVTVGDQVLCEHIFAFHANEGVKAGFTPVISKVSFDQAKSQILIEPRYDMKASDGSPFSTRQMCEAIKESFQGTQHAQFAALVKEIHCSDNLIEVAMTSIPVNMRALFLLPDFSIYSPKALPITATNLQPTTGPYYPVSIAAGRIELKRNPYYPSDLTANQVDQVVLHQYSGVETSSLIEQMNPRTHHVAYLLGQALKATDLSSLRKKGYRVEEYPSEWLAHLGFQPTVNLQDRQRIALTLDKIRDRLAASSPMGQLAYSVPPSDRPFGVKAKEYEEFSAKLESELKGFMHLSRKLTIGTVDSLYDLPVIKLAMEHLKEMFPEQIELKILKRSDFGKLFEPGIDVYLSVQGISAADPAHHLSFFLKSDAIFAEVTNKEEIAKLSTLHEAYEFNREVLRIERKIIEKRALMPLLHFPGVVVSAPGFERDDALAGSWGVRAWTYRIH